MKRQHNWKISIIKIMKINTNTNNINNDSNNSANNRLIIINIKLQYVTTIITTNQDTRLRDVVTH